MALTYRLVVFDLYGTLLDISGMAATLSTLLGKDATALLAAWRTAQLERTWELNRLARYEPFDRVTAWALAKVAGELDEPLRARLAEQWLTVPAHGDAAATLRRLAAAGARTAILSNGTRAMIDRALGAAGLAVDEVRSVEEVRVYKPDPRVYRMLDDLAPADSTLFVSSNAFDAEGAKRSGLRVCFIDRRSLEIGGGDPAGSAGGAGGKAPRGIDRGGAQPAVAPDFHVRALADLVDLVQAP